MSISKVPGDLTCAAHSVAVGLLAEGLKNHEWFSEIKDMFDKIVRKIYDINGIFQGYEVKPHLLRELVPEVVVARGPRFFQEMFGTIWYWGDKEAYNIYGYNDLTSERPHERNFMEYADPFFMVCSYLFKCKIRIVTGNGLQKEFSKAWQKGPVIQVFSNMGNRAGTHFDALLSSDLDKVWFPDPSTFFEPGNPYVVDGHEFIDIVPRIDLWHSYLGSRYTEVIKIIEQEKASHLLVLKYLQEEEDEKFAKELHKKLNK